MHATGIENNSQNLTYFHYSYLYWWTGLAQLIEALR